MATQFKIIGNSASVCLSSKIVFNWKSDNPRKNTLRWKIEIEPKRNHIAKHVHKILFLQWITNRIQKFRI